METRTITIKSFEKTSGKKKADTAKPENFNYFFTSCTGELMAYKLEMLR